MKQLHNLIESLYDNYILKHPLPIIICLFIILSFLGYKAREFKVDASAESLLLENDEDLLYSRKINERYGVYDFLIVSYTPKDGDILSRKSLENLKSLRNELKSLGAVASILSILDVPLLASSTISIFQLSDQILTLESSKVDKKLVRKELQESEFYKDLLVSPDMKTTAVIINLKTDEIYQTLITKRNSLMERQADGRLSKEDSAQLKHVRLRIQQRLDQLRNIQHNNIETIRSITDKYRSQAEVFLGGVSMIADDLITYIKNDLKIFGFGVFILLILILAIIFNKLQWIVLPMLCCFLSVIAMMGFLVIFGWEVTVISSNFVSLQLIITLAISIHLIVRYKELLSINPENSQRELVLKTVSTKFNPCLYAALTTIAGFSSLLLCNIVPVINFGWMMSVGIFLSLTLTFILFPASMMLLKKEKPLIKSKRIKFSITTFFAKLTESKGKSILVISFFMVIHSIIGISRLEVENSFIDYFKNTTEIFQGMKNIDQKLGGTTPLDIIIEFGDDEDALANSSETYMEDEMFLDDLGDSDGDEKKYWFTDEIIEVVEKSHDYLENQPETGKVLSLGTLLKTARKLNNGKPLDSFDMTVLYTKIPDKLKHITLDPYVSIEDNEVRFAIRIKDSLKTLKRDELLKRIRSDLVNKVGIESSKVHLTGTMVLYNNMLQSLFRSQILTLGVVALALFFMLFVLFRSLKLSLIALFPNLLSSCVVLGTMGWFNIPLDMMTITIAAISIGIAVDNTIHYIHRFKEEIKVDNNYYRALHRCHTSIGRALYYTSVTIIIGFSILALSNFYPTLYFGLFTGLAMLIALLAALTLLPQLLIMFKPFKSGQYITTKNRR